MAMSMSPLLSFANMLTLRVGKYLEISMNKSTKLKIGINQNKATAQKTIQHARLMASNRLNF